MILKIYPNPVEVTVVSSFFYIVQNGQERQYNPGETIQVIAKVETQNTTSGKGYIAYNQELDDSFVVDAGLVEL